MENLLYASWFEKRENFKKLYAEENQRIQSDLGCHENFKPLSKKIIAPNYR